MYGLSYYMMALQEAEIARLQYQKRKATQDRAPLPHPTRHLAEVPRRRSRRAP
jgi:hypothetical protein